MHCTIINTVKRKGGYRNRVPFSYDDIFSSQAYKSRIIESTPQAQAEGSGTTATQASESRQPIDQADKISGSGRLGRPDFGIWAVDEIQLCEMGSHDPTTGGYVAAGRIKI